MHYSYQFWGVELAVKIREKEALECRRLQNPKASRALKLALDPGC